MKKYIAPEAKTLQFSAEHNLFLTGSNSYADKDGFQQYSNKAQESDWEDEE